MAEKVEKDRILVAVPQDVTRWLRNRAAFMGGSISTEVTRALRAEMERLGEGARTSARRTQQVANG